MGASVDTPCLAYSGMAKARKLIDNLYGGTQPMRDAGEVWLPRETKELPQDYDRRLALSILYNALADTIEKTAARPFSKPLTLQEKDSLPEALQGLEENADNAGTSLTEFAKACFIDGLKYGIFHVRVDYPKVAEPVNLYQEREYGLHPYLCRVDPNDLIAWPSDYDSAGKQTLREVRIKECRVEAEPGGYGEQKVEYVRVYRRDGWELHRKGTGDKPGEWSIVESGPLSLGEVPLVTVYFTPDGFMCAKPSFENLAWLNLAHWQSYSDQRNLLRVARVPILVVKGAPPPEDANRSVTIGSSSLVTLPNTEESDLFYVEPTGAALNAGNDDLKTLEERMEILGLQPLVSRSGGVTATAKSMDEARTESNIQSWIRATENGLRAAFEMAARWIKQELPEDFAVDIYSDFGLSLKSADDLQALMALYSQGVITAKTLLYECKRRGVVNDMVDVDEEVQAAKDDPPMGMLTLAGAKPNAFADGGDVSQEEDAPPAKAA